MTNSVMKIESARKAFGGNEVLKDISLEVKRGEVVAIIGSSGGGKSTLLRCINLLETPTSGEIRFHDENILSRKGGAAAYRTKVGMVFQQPNPFRKSIRDNITFAPKRHGITDRDELDRMVEESLRGAALWDEVKDKLKESGLGLSGGQQQRLCIARALAVQPEVLLMDEPTSALDPISTSKIEELMEDLKKKYTVVVVTHNMQQAVRVSDDTAFFLVGDMVEFGDTKTIFSYPQDLSLIHI